jgi:hypothetical protein
MAVKFGESSATDKAETKIVSPIQSSFSFDDGLWL